MYKLKISKVSPFWARDNDNKPTEAVFKKWCAENLVDSDLNWNYFGDQNIELIATFNDIKYIQIYDEENNYSKFYMVQNYKTNAQNLFVYNFMIDIYASFTLPFLMLNKDKELVFLRTHEYDPKCLQVEDQAIEALPKFYNSYTFHKKLYFSGLDAEGKKQWYGNPGVDSNFSIADQEDLYNCNQFLVFADGTDGGYRFIPVMSEQSSVNVVYTKTLDKVLREIGEFKNGEGRYGASAFSYYEISKNVTTPALNEKINNAWSKGQKVEYEYYSADSVVKRIWKPIPSERIPFGTLPRSLSGNSFCAQLLGGTVNNWGDACSVNGVEFDPIRRSTGFNFDGNQKRTNFLYESCRFKYKIYDIGSLSREKISVNNSRKHLVSYVAEKGNKLIGLFFLPHLLNYSSIKTEDWNGSKILYLDIGPNGEELTPFNVYKYTYSDTQDLINNPTYANPYVMKYLSIKYYGSEISAQYRVNAASEIFLQGKYLFTDKAYLICKTSELLNLANSVVEFPNMLPWAIDPYLNYIAANRNVWDTGFQIQKDNAFRSQVQATANLGFSLAQTSDKSSAAGIGGNIFSTFFNMHNQNVGIRNNEKALRAQVQQVKDTTQNKILSSSIDSASLNYYYNDSTHDQYEGVEVSDLDSSSLILINNYIALNGYFLPDRSTFQKRVLDSERTWNYIQVDETVLNNVVNLEIDEKTISTNEYVLIKNQLSQGVRILNQENTNFPTYSGQWGVDYYPDVEPEPPYEQPGMREFLNTILEEEGSDFRYRDAPTAQNTQIWNISKDSIFKSFETSETMTLERLLEHPIWYVQFASHRPNYGGKEKNACIDIWISDYEKWEIVCPEFDESKDFTLIKSDFNWNILVNWEESLPVESLVVAVWNYDLEHSLIGFNFKIIANLSEKVSNVLIWWQWYPPEFSIDNGEGSEIYPGSVYKLSLHELPTLTRPFIGEIEVKKEEI